MSLRVICMLLSVSCSFGRDRDGGDHGAPVNGGPALITPVYAVSTRVIATRAGTPSACARSLGNRTDRNARRGDAPPAAPLAPLLRPDIEHPRREDVTDRPPHRWRLSRRFDVPAGLGRPPPAAGLAVAHAGCGRRPHWHGCVQFV